MKTKRNTEANRFKKGAVSVKDLFPYKLSLLSWRKNAILCWKKILERQTFMDKMDEKVVEIEADALARRFELDSQRVRNVFFRLADVRWFAPKFPFKTALDEAIAFVEPQKALEFFEQEDLINLASKFTLVEYLSDGATPLYTLDELANLTQDFISHLKSNKENLIKIGHPRCSYGPSKWLDWHLNKLYYTKLPLFDPFIKPLAELDILLLESYVPHSTTFDRDEGGNLIFDYKWSLDKIASVSRDKAFAESGQQIKNCSYEEAPIIDGLGQKEASSLEEIRVRFFDIKIDILERLHKAITDRNVTDLWRDCLTVLTAELSYDDARFLLSRDDFFAALTEGEDIAFSPYLNTYITHNAGLTDLVEVIGHFEKEITLGTMDGTCKGIANLPTHKSFSSYYEVIGEPWRQEFDDILDDFLDLESQEKRFWEEYRNRVDIALDNEFDIDVIWKARVKVEHAQAFKLYVQTFAEWTKAHCDITGRFPNLQLSQPVDPSLVEHSEEPADFQHSDDFSSVRHNGTVYTFSETQAAVVGFLYDNYKRGAPYVHQKTIREEIGFKGKRLRDLFRFSPAWNTLIVSEGGKKGQFRLNL